MLQVLGFSFVRKEKAAALLPTESGRQNLGWELLDDHCYPLALINITWHPGEMVTNGTGITLLELTTLSGECLPVCDPRLLQLSQKKGKGCLTTTRIEDFFP